MPVHFFHDRMQYNKNITLINNIQEGISFNNQSRIFAVDSAFPFTSTTQFWDSGSTYGSTGELGTGYHKAATTRASLWFEDHLSLVFDALSRNSVFFRTE